MNQQRKKILVFIDWYLPGYKAGGPIKSCVSMVDRLKSWFEFKIITGNTDWNETVPYKNVTSDSWNRINNDTDVFYGSKQFLNSSNIEKLILEEKPDVIYLNSMFSWHFTLVPLWVIRKNKMDVKVVVAPRGMLSKGALALKPLKKKIFLMAARLFRLFNHVTFHASTKIEVDEIRKTFGNDVPVQHAINLTPATTVTIKNRVKEKNKVRLAYIGRISEVKNLSQCLITLANTSSENNFEFDIYGPPDDKAYYELCTGLISKLPDHVKAVLKGPAENSEMNTILSGYHFLFLLSMNENYGHAIVEGFTAGCPVIIGNRTPWRNLEAKKCGWDLPLENNNEIIKVLNTAATMDQETYNQWSLAASAFAKEIHENKKAVDDHLLLFTTSN